MRLAARDSSRTHRQALIAIVSRGTWRRLSNAHCQRERNEVLRTVAHVAERGYERSVTRPPGNGFGLDSSVFASVPRAPALKPALQQAHQAGVPVADHEQNQKRRGEVVVVREGVDDREQEVGSR